MPTLPLCAEKARHRAKEEVREKISPPLDPVVVSAGGRGPPVLGTHLVVKVLWMWACTPSGWPPLLSYSSGAHLIASQKFLKMGQWAWRGQGGKRSLHGLTLLPQRQVLKFLAYMT